MSGPEQGDSQRAVKDSARLLFCFDYDGVIVDSFEVLLSYCQQAQRKLGIGRCPRPYDLQTIPSLTFDALAERIGLSAEERLTFRDTVFELQSRQGWPVQPFAGIATALASLACRHDIVVITASVADTVRDSLARHALLQHVGLVLGGETGLQKAERIVQAMAVFDRGAGSTWMVGDAISDIREGKRAGVHTVAVTWGFQPESALAAEQPDLMVHTPEALIGLR